MNGKDTLIIEGLGGRRLAKGTLRVNGSKNDAVQAIAATILFRDSLSLTNLPQIDDVSKMLTLVEQLGGKIKQRKKSTTISLPLKLPHPQLDEALACQIRASILFTGPLLARYGEVTFPYPGGCVIGERPIDFFLKGFAEMGATIVDERHQHLIRAPRGGLRGTTIFFKNQSVTATETFLMTGLLARGETVLKNCALEPEITNLANFLKSAGGKISGIGNTTLKIQGGNLLETKKSYTVLPDRIEAGSFAIMGALLVNELTLTHCEPEQLEALLNLLMEIGFGVKTTGKSITIMTPKNGLKKVKVKTHEYPGFPTDLQAPLAVLLTQAPGESSVFEAIFEGRVSYAETLNRMGAKIEILDSHRLKITGPTLLNGQTVTSPDLRAGLAYLLAGLVAKGQTIVHNAHYIDRGYEKIDQRLNQIGFKIKRL